MKGLYSLCAVIVTLAIGCFASLSVLRYDLGIIASVSVMGGFICYAILKKND